MKKYLIAASFFLFSSSVNAAIVTTNITGLSPAYSQVGNKINVLVYVSDTLSCGGNTSDIVRVHLGYESNAVNSQTSESFMNYSALVSAAQRGLSVEIDEARLQWSGGSDNFCTIEFHYSSSANLKGFTFKF